MTDFDHGLSQCVACGLCLPHCPTWRITGDEALSPRGRIASMRAVQDGAPIDARFVDTMSSCVQCRGCEPACPSGVPFGALISDVRVRLAQPEVAGGRPPWWLRAGLWALAHPPLVAAATPMLALLQRIRLLPAGLPVPPRLPVRNRKLVASPPASPRRRGEPPDESPEDDGHTPGALGESVVVHTGCVMDAWQRDIHRDVLEVLAALGVRVRLVDRTGQCCGALHHHAGDSHAAQELARQTMTTYRGDDPIVVDSAGCGAALSEYGALLGTSQARRFAERVVDVHTFVGTRLERLGPLPHLGTVVVQDPCHLRHVQRAHEPVRRVLARCATVVELGDDGLCCGAGGAYALQQPNLAGQLRDRKRAAIAAIVPAETEVVVASANPGCLLHLAAGPEREFGRPIDWTFEHPMQILARAIRS